MSRRVGWAVLPIVVTAVVLAVLPSIWFGDSPYTTSLAVQALVFASYGVGFNLIFGSTNQLFLCVGALAGIGGYGDRHRRQRDLAAHGEWAWHWER